VQATIDYKDIFVRFGSSSVLGRVLIVSPFGEYWIDMRTRPNRIHIKPLRTKKPDNKYLAF